MGCKKNILHSIFYYFQNVASNCHKNFILNLGLNQILISQTVKHLLKCSTLAQCPLDFLDEAQFSMSFNFSLYILMDVERRSGVAWELFQ